MQIRVNGLIIMESSLGERDKLITILSKENGLLRAIVRGAKSIRNKNTVATQLFAYSQLILYKNRNGYIVDEADVQEIFFGLRDDICKLGLAQYFCEIALALSPENGDAGDFLRLMLNAFYYIINEKRKQNLIKSVVEIKMSELAGYMPDIVHCCKCGKYEDDVMYLCAEDGKLYCNACKGKSSFLLFPLGKAALTAFRYILYSPFEKIFNFNINDKSLEELNNASEKYIISRTDRSFNTLDFYKSMKN